MKSLATIGEVSNRVDAMNQDWFGRIELRFFLSNPENGLASLSLPLDKKISVSIIIKLSATSYPPNNNMMQRTGSIYAGLTWHHIFILNEQSP